MSLDIGASQISGPDIGGFQNNPISIQVVGPIDGIIFSDNVNVQVGYGPLMELRFNDSIALSDNLSYAAGILLSFADTFTLVDDSVNGITLALIGILTVSITGDAIAFTDAIEKTFGITIGVSDAMTFSDALGQGLEAFRDRIEIPFPGDWILFTDQIVTYMQMFMQQSDVITFLDSVAISLGELTQTLGDSITFSDYVSILLQGIKELNLSDSITFTDSQIVDLMNNLKNLTFTDTITFSDSISVNLSSTFNAYIRRYLNDVI